MSDDSECEGFKCLMSKYGKPIAIGAGIAGAGIASMFLLPEAIGAMGALEMLELVAGQGVARVGVEAVIAGI